MPTNHRFEIYDFPLTVQPQERSFQTLFCDLDYYVAHGSPEQSRAAYGHLASIAAELDAHRTTGLTPDDIERIRCAPYTVETVMYEAKEI